MANIVLIRHGQASFGAADYDCLSTVGEEQSRRLGQWFRQTGQAPDLIATGSLKRHVRTADLCVESAGVVAGRITVSGLDEMDHVEILSRHRPDLVAPGALVDEMERSADPHRAFQSLFVAAAARWTSGRHDAEYTCGWNVFRRNVLDGLQALASQEARTIWAFTSGGPIAVIVNELVGAPADRAFELAWPLVNTSITRAHVSASRRQLVSYNTWPHIEGLGETHLMTHR